MVFRCLLALSSSGLQMPIDPFEDWGNFQQFEFQLFVIQILIVSSLDFHEDVYLTERNGKFSGASLSPMLM